MRTFIDCDPGHDDVLAILLALAHPEVFDIEGITTVAGNGAVARVTDNILRVLDHIGASIPVAMGCARPIRREPEPQPQAHGESGMDGPVLPAARSGPDPRHAVTFLYEEILRRPESVTIVALAPLTNLAILLETYPAVKERIARISLMGGSLHGGNILPRAEFNIYHDPEAAKIVFDSGIPIVMSGLEVCGEAKTPLADFEPLRHGGRVSRLAAELMDYYCGYSRARGWSYTNIFDVVPVAHLIAPNLFTGAEYRIGIETEGELCRGMTVALPETYAGEKNRTTVLEHANGAGYNRLLFAALRALDQMQPD